MEITVIPDRIATITTTKAQTFAKFLTSPIVNSNHVKTARKRVLQKRRRTRRKSRTDSRGPANDRTYDFFFGGEDGPPYGGAGGGGWGGSGSGGNYFGFGGLNWDDYSSAGSAGDPAFDVVYEVLCWIMLSNCLHFAVKKIVRMMAGDDPSEREKVPTIC